MAYWCDDEHIRIEQARLDSMQLEAKKRKEAEANQEKGHAA